MKIISTVVCLLFSIVLLGQSGTTMEEYRYLTKGYAYQEEMGLDHSKEGYFFQTLYENEQTVFIGMYQHGQAPVRAILTILDKDKAKPAYLCLPNNETSVEVMQQYKQDRERILVGYERRKQFEEANRGLLFARMDPYTPHVQQRMAIQLPQEPGTIEMTSKGIPVQPSYQIPPSYQQTDKTPYPTSASAPKESTTYANPAVEPAVVNTAVQSSVGGALEKRGLAQAIVVRQAHNSQGKVAIKLCVDALGDVISAKFTQMGSTTFNRKLKEIATKSARSAKFTPSSSAEECGIITFTFR